MSRSSKGFADFFPTAPSVLQQKRSKASQDRRRPQFPSVDQQISSHALSVPLGSSHGESEGGALTSGLSNGDISTKSTSLPPEENEGANGDISHEVGSTSSTSTASSVFSAANREFNMAHHEGPRTSTSLTPLTNIGSSPRASGVNSPPKRRLHDPHLLAGGWGRSPSRDCNEEVFTASGSALVLPQISSAPQARPGKGTVKGFKAVYDPDLDKTLKGKEKRSRQVQYKPFGEDVCLISATHLLCLYSIPAHTDKVAV